MKYLATIQVLNEIIHHDTSSLTLIDRSSRIYFTELWCCSGPEMITDGLKPANNSVKYVHKKINKYYFVNILDK